MCKRAYSQSSRNESQNTKRELRFRALLGEDEAELSLTVV
jgi:hypothetical protein